MAAQLIVANQNYFSLVYVKGIEALEIFPVQERIMQMEGDNYAVNRKSQQ